MKQIISLLVLVGFLFIGCEKDKNNPVTTPPAGSSTFTSNNVKTSPVYFSLAKCDSFTSAESWDLKLTTLYAPNDSTNSFKFPGIVLNPASGVTAK